MDRLTNDMVQQATRKQAMAFRLPTVQEEVAGWREASMSICSLDSQDFLPHCDFCGTRDWKETQKEETLVLARALQHCVEVRGSSQGAMLCGRGLPEVYGAPHVPQRWWNPGSLTTIGHRQRASSIPNSGRRRHTLGWGSHTSGGLGHHHMPCWLPRGDPWPQSYSQSSGPPGYSPTNTFATTGVWTTHLSVLPTSPGRCRAPTLHPWRSLAGYNLPGLHIDYYSQECPNGWVWMLIQTVAHLNDIPTARPIWDPGPAWCWLGTNGLVDPASNHS